MTKLYDFKLQLSREAVALKKSENGNKNGQQQNQGGQASAQEDSIATQLISDIQKLNKDFSYLRKPSILPRAYECSLIEMKRRMNFRKGLDSYVVKLKKVIDTEKERRNTFISNQV